VEFYVGGWRLKKGLGTLVKALDEVQQGKGHNSGWR
jgi:hypothetical protein